MKREDARLWVKALRNEEEYPKTVGSLKNGHGYCCLGVLCSVFQDDLKKKGFDIKEDKFTLSIYEHVRTLPVSVLKYFEIEKETASELMKVNDDSSSFTEVIEIIEKEYMGA